MSRLGTSRLWAVMVALLFAMLAVGSPASADDDDNGGNGGGGNGKRGRLHGTYDLVVSGDYTGQGTIKVKPRKLQISVKLAARDGSTSVDLQLPNLEIVDGHFKAEQTIDGVTIKVTGRVEADDGKIVAKPRVTCLILDGDDRIARGVAHRTGN